MRARLFIRAFFHSSPPPSASGPWTKAEDELLRKAVAQHGNNWVAVSRAMGYKRCNRQCRHRWAESLCDTIPRRPFTSPELIRLSELSERHPGQWARIATELGTGHTGSQVYEVLNNRLNQELIGKKWSEDEDAILKSMVETLGEGKWTEIAKSIQGRSDAMCYVRWTFALRPGLKRGRWSEEEDRKLIEGIRKGEGYSEVAERVGRDRKMCRQRYYLLKKQGRVEDVGVV